MLAWLFELLFGIFGFRALIGENTKFSLGCTTY